MSAATWLPTWVAIAPVANHLWQSTIVAALAGLLALALRRNRAQVRYWLWLAASMKFLIPFVALTAIGSQFPAHSPVAVAQTDVTVIIEAVSQPFSRSELGAAAAGLSSTSSAVVATIPVVLAAVWFGGAALILAAWSMRWRRIAATIRHGSFLQGGREVDALRRLEAIAGIEAPIAIVSANTSLEPGVFGIVRPLLLWPRGIGEQLADDQIEAILAHELSHVRRRDNLAAAVHMLVEALFWFHPLVWWLGARLVDERERACDEAVVELGSAPQVYAESILKTCQFSLETPLVCAAGVTGSDLKKRIELIMRNDVGRALNRWRKLSIVAAGTIAFAGPVAVGALDVSRPAAQAPATEGKPPAFEVASIKPNKSGDGRIGSMIQPGGRFTATNITLGMLLGQAYRLQGGRGGGPGSANPQILNAPGWINSDRFDIVAKADANVTPDQFPELIRSLLIERFKLAAHTESRELQVYALVLARADGKLGPGLRPASAECATTIAARGRGAPPPGGPGGPGGVAGLGGPGRGPIAPPQPGEPMPCGMMRFGPGSLAAGGTPISQLATSLTPWVNRIVLDKTGLTGPYEIDLKWTPEQIPGGGPEPGGGPPGTSPFPSIDPNGPSVFTAVQEQLGLKLDSTRAPVDVLVIDRVEHPTED